MYVHNRCNHVTQQLILSPKDKQLIYTWFLLFIESLVLTWTHTLDELINQLHSKDAEQIEEFKVIVF